MELSEARTTEAAVFVEALNANASRGPDSAAPPTLLFLKQRVRALRFELADVRAENEVLRAELKAARERGDRFEAHIQIIYASRGWRLVTRLRSMRDFLLRLAGMFRSARRPPACEDTA
jgi:hypothetical protein